MKPAYELQLVIKCPRWAKRFVSMEYMYCHAIKNKIKNHAVDKVKKL